MTELAIDIKNLTKIYSSKKATKLAVDDLSMQIEKGKIFGLLGPNGAGKSTFINILAGIVNKTSGAVKVTNIDLDKDPVALRYKLGIVPQEIMIDPFFTVKETLEIYAGYFGVPKSQRRTMEIIKALGLADKVNAKSRQLSGGMKRRLLVAKALVHNPDILILYEPTAGVDVELRTQLWEYVRDLNKQGMTIVLTTHYLEEAQELCDDIAIINEGKVVVQDKKANLMKLLDNKEIVISLAEEIKKIPKQLDKFAAEQIAIDEIRINYKTKEVAVGDILKEIAAAGLDIKDISIQEPDLEDVFRFIVNRKTA